MLKALVNTVITLVCGAFAFLLGAVFMTGLNLSLPINMIGFLGYNGFVLLGVVLALKQIWSNRSGQW
jgi:hypothetical protein